MRIILFSIISWFVLVCIAVITIFLISAILKFSKKGIEKIGVSKNELIFGLFISIIVIIISSIYANKYLNKTTLDKSFESKLLKLPSRKIEQDKELQLHLTVNDKEQILKDTTKEKRVESSLHMLQEEKMQKTRIEEKKLLESQISLKKFFTVQIGAFTNLTNAKTLERSFIKKGYKAYIITSLTLEKRKLFKVCIEKFIKKEDAKILSEQISNREGLKTFVTYCVTTSRN